MSNTRWRVAARRLLFSVALAGLAASAPAAEPPNLRLLTPPDPQAPTRVDVALYDLQILSIDEPDQVFHVGGRMQLRWFDPRQSYDPAAMGTDRLEYQGESAVEQVEDEVWSPDLEFVDAVGPRDRLSVNLTLDDDGLVWYRERFEVRIKQDFYLETFPFDQHVISFRLEPFTYGASSVELVPAEDSQMPTSWEPTEWMVGDPEVEFDSGIRHYCVGPGDGGGEEAASGPFPGPCPGAESCPAGTRCETELGISSVTVALEIQRVASHYVGNIILPLLLIVLITAAVFFLDLDATHLGDRLVLSFTALLTVVAFDFVSSGSLPKLWYSTTLDRVITASYVFVAISIALLVWVDLWHRGGGDRARRAATLTRFSRWLFPLAYLVTVAVLVLRAM